MGKRRYYGRAARLDALGEDKVFARYLELGSTKALAADVYDEDSGAAVMALYDWLHSVPGRWERWQKTIKARGHIEADKVLEVAENATKQTAHVDRLKLDAHKWRASVLNREDYGPPNKDINVNLGLGNAWLQALTQPQEPKLLQATELCDLCGCPITDHKPDCERIPLEDLSPE